jgi:RNA polymerase sigma factor (sigma-70 family)
VNISFALRDDPLNVYMMTEGAKDHPEYTQTFIFRKKPIAPDFLQEKFILASKAPQRDGLTTFGEEFYKCGWDNPLTYIAEVDSQVEFLIKSRIFEEIQTGFLPLHTADYQQNMFDGQQTGFLVFLRVYQGAIALPSKLLNKGCQGSSQIIRLYDENELETDIDTEIVQPVRSSNSFNYIRDEILHILRKENALIAVYDYSDNGIDRLQKRISAEKLFSPKREYEYDPDNLVDMAQSDYAKMFAEVIDIEPGLRYFIEYVSEIIPPQMRETEKLIVKAKEGDHVSQNRLIEMYLRVAVRNALYVHKRYKVNLEDAIQESIIGLTIAIDKYDLKSDNKFSTYAPWWMRQNMMRELPIAERVFRLPIHFRDKLQPILDAFDSHECQQCSVGNFCEKMITDAISISGCDRKTAIHYLRYALWTDSIEYLQGIQDPRLSDHGFFEDVFIESDMRSHLAEEEQKVLNTLSKKEADILKRRNGIGYEREQTLEEIGEVYGVTRERIRQIETKALKHLRHPSRGKKLRPYWEEIL